MRIAVRDAEILWNGRLASGTGTLSSGSGGLGQLDVTWVRTERPDRKMSIERLIAAAQAWEQLRRPAGAFWDSESDRLRVGLGGRKVRR